MPYSDQAEASVYSPIAPTLQNRILIELEVISHLLSRSQGDPEDLRQLRESIAASLTST